MIRTYYTNIENISLTELNISKVSPQRREKIKRLINETSKKQSLGAGLLINKLFPDCEIKTEKYGKLYIEDGFEFNLAHSDNYVILSVSNDAPVGCDIEKPVECKYEKLAKVVFHKNEMEYLKNSQNKQEVFFDLWTKKEAFLKCIGMGFHYKSKKIDLTQNKHFTDFENQRFRFKEYMLDGYKIMLCSPAQDFAPDIKEIVFD